MRPILLKIKGLNSFYEEQTVDFNRLTSKGLFGIFGPTGSGKTSIIDAITLALYGEVSRYDGDSKNKKFININSELCTVYFEFAMSRVDGEDKYIVERSYKRHNDTQKVVYARFYKLLNEGSEVLADKATKVNSCVEEIIGLSYKDFSKTVVLPQGKFSEFLLLANSERRNMLERIFRLEKYGEDLLNVIRKEYGAKSQDFKILNTKLDMYGDINKSLIKQKEIELTNINIKYEELIIEQKKITEKSVYLKKILELYNQQQMYEAKLSKLKKVEEEIELNKKFLKKANYASLIIPIYEEIKHTQGINLKNTNELKVHMETYERLLIEEKKFYKKLNDINKFKDEKIPCLIQKEHNLNQALKLIKEKQDIETQRKDMLKQYSNINHKLESTKRDIEELEKKKSNIKNDINLLLERKNSIRITPQFNRLVEDGVNIKNKLNENEEDLKLILNKHNNIKYKTIISKKEIKIINDKIYNNQLIILKLNNVAKNRYKLLKLDINNLKNEISKLEIDLLDVKKFIKEADRTKLIYELSERLEYGKPCEVCGSLVHDSNINNPPINNIDIHLEKEKYIKLKLDRKKNILNEYNYKLLNLESLYKSIESNLNEFKNVAIDEEEIEIDIDDTNIEELLVEIQQNLNKLQTDKKVLSISLDKDIESLKDKEEEILDLKNKAIIMEKALEDIYKKTKTNNLIELSNNIKEFEIELTSIDEKELSSNKLIEDINLKLEILNRKHQSIRYDTEEIVILGKEKASLIKKYETDIFKITRDENVEPYINNIRNEVSNINKEAEEFKVKYDRIKEQLDKVSELKAGLEKEKDTLKNILSKQQLKLERLIIKYSFKSIEEVLQYNIDNDKFKEKEKEIENFDKSKDHILNNIKRVKEEIGDMNCVDIDNKVYEIAIKETNINNKVLDYSQKAAILRDNIKKMKLDWDVIVSLEKEKKILNSYLDILKDLNKLFEGKKFVEFVAKKQLMYIAADASVRLKDMSCGRYALELDDTDFVIRDDHYGGIRRSPKTLSGGETFMASLCLALALSSKIQLKNKSSLEFFFLDEGFGTLDLASLEVVMESLVKLHSQKMKVGVITHVEEMKSSIPVKLVVVQPNHGLHGTLLNIE